MYWFNATNIVKRSLYAGVFVCLFGCQPESYEQNPKPSDPLPQQSELQTPLLSLDELLNADDFQAGIKLAVINEDSAALEDWQQQLLAAAKEVRLSQRDLNKISGKQGLMFIQFEAKKQLFHDEFVERFMHFENIDDLIEKYPYLTGVHQRALLLISERDRAIQRAAKLLADDGLQGDAVKEARAQWRDYMLSSGKLSILKN
ncbi:hypothetical protein [Glaciecola sp. MF2-115]|uniref:hypothetical protein n=1 Tax=Glaciecola sp. MF2-115 TaxID=3384827 RepID=UPI0039A0DBFE